MYKIVRIYYPKINSEGRVVSQKRTRTIQTGLTLEEAQAHCKNPETKVKGVYFDGYEET